MVGVEAALDIRVLRRRLHDHPRFAASDSWRSLRYARVCRMNYRDKLASKETGSTFNRRHRAKWVRIQPALTPELPLVNKRLPLILRRLVVSHKSRAREPVTP
jgi:hypothetical protein